MSCEECLQEAKVEESVDAWDRVEALEAGETAPCKEAQNAARTN
jgi:hypothetical protein